MDRTPKPLIAKFSTSGRITIPKVERDRLGLKPGDLIDWSDAGDGVRLRVVREGHKFRGKDVPTE